jgi:hypothetical protein
MISWERKYTRTEIRTMILSEFGFGNNGRRGLITKWYKKYLE